jgi:hypothetical protein
MQFTPGVVAKPVAGHADLAATAGQQGALIEIGPLLVATIVRRWAGLPPDISGAGRGRSHGDTIAKNTCTSRRLLVLASSGANPGGTLA